MSTKTKKRKIHIYRIAPRQPRTIAGMEIPRLNPPRPVDVERLRSHMIRAVGPKRARELKALMSTYQELQSLLMRLDDQQLVLGVNGTSLYQARLRLQESAMWCGTAIAGAGA